MYCRIWGFIFAWDLGVIFSGIPSFKIFGFWKKTFLKIQILRCHKKMCRLIPCIPIFRGLFWLKSVNKCVCVLVLKITLLLAKNLFFGVKKCMSNFWRQVAAKYTTLEAKFSFTSVLSCILQREHCKAIK